MGKVPTLQDNIKKPVGDVTKYSLFLGGMNTKNAALAQYDTLRTGYGRIFILLMPKYVEYLLPNESKKFKHLLEYGNTGIDGIAGYSVDFASVTGGYAGMTAEIPVNVKDDTTSITVKLYETSGSMVRTYIDFWITGVGDVSTGLSHYHDARKFDPSLVASQANQTMEAIYVATDQTGEQIEYACLLTNMFPKGSDHSHFNYESGSHDLATVSIEFTATKLMSPQINSIGKALLDKFVILRNYLQIHSGYDLDFVNQLPKPEIEDWK